MMSCLARNLIQEPCYRIPLIFSERKLLDGPEVMLASGSVFFDEAGKRVRTRKEITG